MSANRSLGEWDLAIRQQAALAHLGQFGLQSSDLDLVVREAMVVAADTLAITDVALFELDAANHVLRAHAALRSGRVLPRRSLGATRVPTGTGSLPGFAVHEATTVVAGDLLGDPRFTSRAPDYGVPVRAAVAAPIAWEREPFGALVVYGRTVREWTDDEVHFVEAIATTVGLAAQRSQIEQELRDSSTRLDLSLSAGGLGAWSWDLRGDRLTLNASAAVMYGLTRETVIRRGTDFLALIHPEDRDSFWDDAQQQVATGAEQRHVFRVIRPDTGELRWIESWGRQLDAAGPSTHVVGVCSDITERRRAEQLQEAILASEQLARIEAETARERLAFLAEASAVLSSSLDPEVTLTSLADLCVPGLADLCFIDLLDDEGSLQQQAGRAVSEAMLHDALSLRRRRRELGPAAPTQTGHNTALRGHGVVHTAITDEQLAVAAADADHLALMRRVDARSTIMVPIVARGRTIGVLTLVRRSDSRPYDEAEDLPFVEELAARAALAIDNGRLFHSRNRVARSLQEALLPPAMPAVDGLALAARYHVAEADVEIGGDFYDVIPLAPQTWGVVIGDVCGRGPDAAALTGLVRHTLRTAVMRERVPSRVLAQTNEAVLQQIDDARFCTVAYLLVEQGASAASPVRVSASSAGHPRPVLLRADGTAELVECAGTLMGVVHEPELLDVTLTLGPLDAVVLYTDGVTEARSGAQLFGERRLLEALRGLAGRSAEEIADGLDAAAASFRRSARDDTAIVVVQALPRP